MSVLIARWADGHLAKYGAQLEALHRQFPNVLPRIVNQVGDRAKTQVIRNLTKQTGLPRRTIVKAVGDPARATKGHLEYGMKTRGGNIRLKYFSPRETRAGVKAKPLGAWKLFPGTFMKGGRFPGRKEVARFEGHVWRRLDTRGRHITQVRSDVYIPREMTQGATATAFRKIAAPLLQERVDAALVKFL